jgi:peptide/nickel transport system permease protein
MSALPPRSQRRRDPRFLFGVAILGLGFAAGLLAPWIAPYDPNMALGRDALSLVPPRAGHWLGTDIQSRDLLSRMLYGARASLGTASLAAALATSLGALVGLAAGTLRGFWDSALMRLADFFLAIPGIVILMAAGAILGQSEWTVILVLAATGWMETARLVRADVLALSRREFVLASVGLGFSWGVVIRRHVLPNVLAPVVVSASQSLGRFLVAESVVSFLGFGIPEPGASWGKMVYEGIDRMREGWWVSLFPALAIAISVTAANLLGDSLREEGAP